jgi:LmbE family N-acetylglucosaminyl deacetylase
MAKGLSAAKARRLAQTLTGLRARPLDRAAMLAPAIVFSPHQDDETLGCGGTIVKKRRLGARVQMVYLTDGSGSPPNLPAGEVKALREREARAACQQLGIEPENVTFCGFVDGGLTEAKDRAIERVAEYLREHLAEQVYIPYRQDRDPGLDHVAAHEIVLSALREVGFKGAVYEYPIWYWRFWPQTRIPIRGQHGVWKTLPRSRPANLRALAEFNACVEIEDVLEDKRIALEEHRSQMAALNSIRSGAFRRWFFGKREVFYRHAVS